MCFLLVACTVRINHLSFLAGFLILRQRARILSPVVYREVNVTYPKWWSWRSSLVRVFSIRLTMEPEGAWSRLWSCSVVIGEGYATGKVVWTWSFSDASDLAVSQSMDSTWSNKHETSLARIYNSTRDATICLYSFHLFPAAVTWIRGDSIHTSRFYRKLDSWYIQSLLQDNEETWRRGFDLYKTYSYYSLNRRSARLATYINPCS